MHKNSILVSKKNKIYIKQDGFRDKLMETAYKYKFKHDVVIGDVKYEKVEVIIDPKGDVGCDKIDNISHMCRVALKEESDSVSVKALSAQNSKALSEDFIKKQQNKHKEEEENSVKPENIEKTKTKKYLSVMNLLESLPEFKNIKDYFKDEFLSIATFTAKGIPNPASYATLKDHINYEDRNELILQGIGFFFTKRYSEQEVNIIKQMIG